MTTTRPTALRAHRTRRLLRASPVAAAVSTLLLSAGGVQAQQADAAQTVVVTGIRRGIETSVRPSAIRSRSSKPFRPRTSASCPT